MEFIYIIVFSDYDSGNVMNVTTDKGEAVKSLIELNRANKYRCDCEVWTPRAGFYGNMYESGQVVRQGQVRE
jgi:hypothetical protein